MAPNAAEAQVKMGLILPPDLPVLNGDRGLLKQLVLNLLSNAIKYNRPNGQVTLSAAQQANEIAITVEDTGRGLTEDEVQHLFEKYFRAQSNAKTASGTGLGLSICKKIVEGHRGTIYVESRIDKGTSFKVCLPLID
jgi:two-component system sensor histidine kinase VicK